MYHSKTDTLVMTNEPDLPKQKELLKKYSDWGGDIELPDGLPGSVSSPDRFVRLEYYLQYLPEPATDAEVGIKVATSIADILGPLRELIVSYLINVIIDLLMSISILIHADPLCLLPFSCCYRSF